MDPTEAITKLYAKHESSSGQNFGVNVDVCSVTFTFSLSSSEFITFFFKNLFREANLSMLLNKVF